MVTEYVYNVAIETDSEQVLVDWGNQPGWMDHYRELLDTAHTISLIPKDGYDMPVVSVRLGNGRRWVLFTRVYGRIPGGLHVRMYAIGWQATVSRVNVRALTWVYPTGAVECADEPSYVMQLL